MRGGYKLFDFLPEGRIDTHYPSLYKRTLARIERGGLSRKEPNAEGLNDTTSRIRNMPHSDPFRGVAGAGSGGKRCSRIGSLASGNWRGLLVVAPEEEACPVGPPCEYERAGV